MIAYEKRYLIQYLSKLDSRILDSVEYISIDMHKPYLDISTQFFRHAKVAVDAFHVIQQLQQCIYGIRNRILKHYLPNTHEYYLLKHWHSLLIEQNEFLFSLPSKYNKLFKMVLNRQQLLDKLLNIHIDLRNTYTVFYLYMDFNQYNYAPEKAQSEINEIILNILNCNVPELNNFTQMIIIGDKKL